MKFLKPLLWASILLICVVGCSGKTETVGELPDIQVSGSVLGGALRNAEVILVGVNANGQPQKFTNNDGVEDYTGDRLYTDGNGEFTGFFNGAYVGPLLVVARKSTAEDQITTMTCSLQQGCLDSDGANVAYGDQYAVPDDFEIWGIDVGVKQGDRLEISWLTHLAAKLSHSTFVSDGTNCTPQDCTGVTPVTGLITAQTAFKANDLVRNLFSLSSNPIKTKAYNPVKGSTTTDTVLLAQETAHGMLALQVEQVAKDNNETLMAAFKRLETEFLSHRGQLYQDRAGDSSISLKSLLTDALNEATALQTAGLSNSGLDQTVGQLQTLLAGTFTMDALTTANGADYIADLADQIADAKSFIQNSQTWINDIGDKQYASYFGDEVAADLSRFDGLWQTFEPVLTDNLEALYWLQMDFVEYAMTCVRTGLTANACDTAHVMHANSSFDAPNSRLTYIDGETELVAKIETISESADFFYRVSFTKDLVLETTNGRVFSGLDADENLRAYAQIGLNKTLAANEDPYIVAVGVFYPELSVRQKNGDGTCCDAAMRFNGENLVYEATGTKDVTDQNSPVHYNLLSVNMPGTLKDAGNESIDIAFVVNSDASSATLYYAENKYPELDIDIDMDSFKAFARLEAFDEDDEGIPGIDDGTNKIAGWLEARSDIPANDAFAGGLEYTATTSVSLLDSSLREILNLPSSPAGFEFGGFNYAGGETKIAIWRDPDSTDARNLATQCVKSKGLWSCTPNVHIDLLGCNADQQLGNKTAGLLESFNFLRDQNCIPEVKIEGRGVYAIDYTNGTSEIIPFTEGQTYNIELNYLFRLEIDSSSFRALTRFNDASGEALPIANFSMLAQAIMVEEAGENNLSKSIPLITYSGSITESYQGTTSQSTNGLDWLVPYGEKNLWMAIGSGQNSTSQDEAAAYYIQNESVTLSIKAFDQINNDAGDSGIVGFVRYAGVLLGTIRKEGDDDVIRYIDDSWQLLELN